MFAQAEFHKYFKTLLFLCGPLKKRLPLFVVFFLLASGLDLIGVAGVGTFVSLLDPGGQSEFPRFHALGETYEQNTDQVVLLLGVGLLVLFIVKNLVGFLLHKKIFLFSAELLVGIRRRAMTAYQGQKYIEFAEEGLPYYTRGLLSYTNQFMSSVTAWLTLISEITVAVALIIFLALYEWVITLYLVGTGVLFIFCYNFIIRSRIEAVGQIQNEATRSLIRGVNEGLRGFKELRVAGKQSVFQKRIEEASKQYGQAFVTTNLWVLLPKLILEIMLVGSVVFIIGYTVLTGRIVAEIFPFLAMFAAASLRLAPSVTLVTSGIVKIRKQKPAIDQLAKDLSRLHSRAPSWSISNQDKTRFSVLQVKDVSFQFPGGRKHVVKQASMQIERGEFVGILGESGSGKTTFIDLISGIIKPTSGVISFNGESIEKKGNQLWGIVSYLPQQPVLFDTTIRENLLLFGSRCTPDKDRELRRLLEVVELCADVEQMAEKLETIVGDDAVRLSGGQRQRLALARALYSSCELLLLDEATSAIDEEMAVRVLSNIRAEVEGRTMLMVSHSKQALRQCDKVYSMHAGNLVFLEDGL